MDESSLIQRVQEGDVEAFGGLMELHAARLRGTIALAAPAAHLIDEIAQEAFVFAYAHLHEFRRGTSFSAWLGSIARNLLRREVLRYSRERRNRRRYAEGRLHEADPRERSSAQSDLVERVLGCVTPEARELLELRYRGSLGTGEIARRLGRSEGWVRTTLWRIRRQLRDGLDALRSSPEGLELR